MEPNDCNLFIKENTTKKGIYVSLSSKHSGLFLLRSQIQCTFKISNGFLKNAGSNLSD